MKILFVSYVIDLLPSCALSLLWFACRWAVVPPRLVSLLGPRPHPDARARRHSPPYTHRMTDLKVRAQTGETERGDTRAHADEWRRGAPLTCELHPTRRYECVGTPLPSYSKSILSSRVHLPYMTLAATIRMCIAPTYLCAPAPSPPSSARLVLRSSAWATRRALSAR
jgi:hypothetical protein